MLETKLSSTYLRRIIKIIKTAIHYIYSEREDSILLFIRNLVILISGALLTACYLNHTGVYPWGSDTYGHLFKGNILYEALKEGHLFINYHENWYNGVQPFRYWAPLPYYVLAIINLFTNNIMKTYNLFIVLTFVLGGLGWLCWGYYLRRQNLGLIFAVLWFFVPNNLRVLFSEGNLPYVLVNSLLPVIVLFYYQAVRERKLLYYILLSLSMFIVTLSHAMLSAMLGMSLFILAVFDSLSNTNYMSNLGALIFAFLGIMLSSFWLYPALQGGIMGLNKEAVANVMSMLTYPLTSSLNPLLRYENIEVYYFGLAFAVTAIFGVFMSNNKERSFFIAAIIIFLGTTKGALPLLQKLPMNQLFWMRRFTSIAMVMIMGGLLLWKRLRKSLVVLVVVLLVMDGAASFQTLGFKREYPYNIAQTLDTALEISRQRIGILDNSSWGSFPSFYLAYNPTKSKTDQIYGWAWQGAGTASNIVALNTALEEGYYAFMFDRALELGADTLVVRKGLIRDGEALDDSASKVGYERYSTSQDAIIYKYPCTYTFGTKPDYKGVAIGTYAANIPYLFPEIRGGRTPYLDDYTYDELKKEKVIFLSGFKYRNKNKAENLLLKLSRSGTRVVLDVTGFDRNAFLGVRAEPITIYDNYQELYYKGQKLKMKNFPQEYKSWNTYMLQGVDNEENYGVIDSRVIKYRGKKDNDNLYFIALNLPYYAFLTKDAQIVKILEDTLDLQGYKPPHRDIGQVAIEREQELLKITGEPEVMVPLAALDAFQKSKGDFKREQNLLCMQTSELEIEIGYPYLKVGIIGSFISLAILLSLVFLLNKNYDKIFIQERSIKG